MKLCSTGATNSFSCAVHWTEREEHKMNKRESHSLTIKGLFEDMDNKADHFNVIGLVYVVGKFGGGCRNRMF